MTQRKKLPPIIEGWIDTLLDPKVDKGIRENHLFMLEHVRTQCTSAIQQYNIDKYSTPNVKKKRA
jgi:hypothetical protein